MMLDSLIVIGLATISLGNIQEADGVKEHTFWLRNCGNQKVMLAQGYTSCGCTTIHFEKDKAVAPGDSTAVTLRFNPRGKGGEFEEVGTIVYGQKHKRLQMSLIGHCITSEETLLRQFPIRVSDTLRLSTNRFDLGIMHQGETKERTVVVLHRNKNQTSMAPIRFTVDAKTPKGLQHIVYPIKVGGQQVNITLDVLVK
jgi:hypothetical protein